MALQRAVYVRAVDFVGDGDRHLPLRVRLRNLDGAQTRLSMLLDYRREYENRLNRASEDGVDAERLRNYRRFLAQLDQAIEQQTSQAADAQSSVEQARETWQGLHREVQSYDALKQRAAQAQAKHERRVEQKRLYEHVASRARHAPPPKPK